MLRNQPQLIHFLTKNSQIYANPNIDRLKFIRNKKCTDMNQNTCFSNEFLKQNISKRQRYEDVVQLKLQNNYSPRKTSSPVKTAVKKLQKVNPYKQAIQKMRNYEHIMLFSLQKSLHVSKKMVFQQRDSSTLKFSSNPLSRSKTTHSLHDLINQTDKNLNNYEYMVATDPEVSKYGRMIQSAIIEKPSRTRIKSISVQGNYNVQKSYSEPKFREENIKLKQCN